MRAYRFSILRILPWAALVASAVACGPSNGAKGPRPGDSNALARSVVAALEAEQTKPAAEALDKWLAVLQEAREVRGTPLARESVLAAIDALLGDRVLGLEELGAPAGLITRAADGKKKAIAALDATLESDGVNDPMVRAEVASARMLLAAQLGDAAGFAKAQAAAGCATEATIVGPFPGPSLGPLHQPGPVDAGTIDANYAPLSTASSPPLALSTKPMKSEGNGCTLDVVGTSVANGLRYAVIDVDVPSAQKIAIGVESSLPLQVLVAGKAAITMEYPELAESLTKFGWVEVKDAGTVRVVAKIGSFRREELVLYAIGEDGTPLKTHAAAIGAAPSTPIGAVVPETAPAIANTVEARVTTTLGLLAMGDAKRAEATIAEIARPIDGNKPNPAAALVYARALRYAYDLPEFRRLERLRAAYEAALEGWPSSWEAIIGHGQIVAMQRRGGAGDVEAIADTRKRRDALGGNADPLIDAYLALVGDDVYGVREDSLGRVKPRIGGTPLAWYLDLATVEETAELRAKRECDPARPDLSRTSCMQSKYLLGDHAGALAEIARLRTLYGSPKLLIADEVDLALKDKGVDAARAIYLKSDLSDRNSYVAKQLAPAGKEGVAWLRSELRALEGDGRAITELVASRRAAGDSSVGADLAATYEPKTKALIDADRKTPAMDKAGTAILGHEERYEMGADGFVHVTFWDVRRLSGTSDVEANAVARIPSGTSGSVYSVVHRVFKTDGTVVEPDRIAAAQSGAELALIEAGDYVELVAEGWFAARPDGAFEMDTPDLLPQRTAVVNASISFTTPSNVPLEVWAHAELGKAATSEGNGAKTTTWTLANHDVRRSEKGQSSLDAAVAVRVASWQWSRIGRDAREGLLAEQDQSYEVSQWVAQSMSGDHAPTIDLLARLEKAVKRALPRTASLPLGGGEWGFQSYDARTVLLDAVGSRIALARRALDELGVKNEVVWAEQGPYSADPKMVPRYWRFTHALLVAYVAAQAGDAPKPVWMDLDVDGYPPPPGRTSPELRGRSAINTAGEIIPVPANPSEDPDAITIDLTVDDEGKATGDVVMLLKSANAQEVSTILEEDAGDERDDALQSYVLGWVPDADVTEVSASTDTWQVSLRAKIAYPHFLTPDGKKFAIAGVTPLHAGRAITIGQTFAAQSKRTTPLTIRYATNYTIHRVVRLPNGTSLVTPLPDVSVVDAITGMTATRKDKGDGATLTDDIAFSLPTSVVQPEQFEKFVTAARAIDDGFGSVVRVVPAASMKLAPATPATTPKPKLKP